MAAQDTGVGIVAFDHESVTIAAAITTLTSATYLDATSAEITLETAQVRYRFDGGDPSATVGHLLEVGDVLKLTGTKQIANFKAYRTGGSSGVAMVSYLR